MSIERNYRNQKLIAIFWLIAILLGIVCTWDARHDMNPDGISYIDMGDAFSRGDWNMAINASRSPFYPWLLGLALRLFKPPPYWEFAMVHLVNFMLYLSALFCFQFFLYELLCHHHSRIISVSKDKYMVLPKWVLLVLGYTLFIWSSLYMITVGLVIPEMCVSAFVYLISGILLRIHRQSMSWLNFILLGLFLGFSYLTKTIMFLLAFIFLGISLFLTRDLRRKIPRVLIALIVFLLVGAPFIIALSNTKGRLTFGDIGKLVYVDSMSNLPLVHWQGEPSGSGRPKHPTRKLYDIPAVYEFATPIGGTYPPWYDPCYWKEGSIFHFDLKKQIKVLIINTREIVKIFFNLPIGILIIATVVLYFMSRRRWLWIKDIVSESWDLFIPSILALATFLLLHLEPRYVAVFIVLLWMAVFSGMHFPESQELKILINYVVSAAVVLMMSFIIILTLPKFYSVLHDLIKGEDKSTHIHWRVADTLRQVGVQMQDRVVFFGDGYSAYWARLARVKIVAEIPSRSVINFWAANNSAKAQIIKILEQTGAKVIVTRDAPQDYSSTIGWQRIGGTEYYFYLLKK